MCWQEVLTLCHVIYHQAACMLDHPIQQSLPHLRKVFGGQWVRKGETGGNVHRIWKDHLLDHLEKFSHTALLMIIPKQTDERIPAPACREHPADDRQQNASLRDVTQHNLNAGRPLPKVICSLGRQGRVWVNGPGGKDKQGSPALEVADG